MGRPCEYTEAVVEEVCRRLAQGESLRSICRDEHLPTRGTIHEWYIRDINGFSSRYLRARELGYAEIADETMDIVDDGRNDWIERESQRTGKTYVALNEEAIARSRLRADNRWRYLGKMAPKTYGDKLQQEITNPDGSLTNSTPEQIAAKLAAIQRAAEKRKKAEQDGTGDDLV